MLTLKAPIQLHIAQGLTGNMDTFGERIRGNYSLLGAHYTPKDLLFLLTAPPELPEELGGMTTLVSQQNHVDVRSVTMDVVNHVVNRILLDGTEQFTYQDQVYITTVLNRLGITNVSQFMEQVRQLRTENESTVQMTRLYRSELERILQRQTAGEPAPALPIAQQAEEEETTLPRDPRVMMTLEILQRLNTTNLYEMVHSFQRNWSGGMNRFQHNEFRLAEQMRFANAVSLTELKQQIYQHPRLQLLHHLNQYETGVLLEAPRDEEAVLSQAAVAALVTAVDHTVTEVLNRPQLRQEQWIHIENAIWQTAENTLSRFETYHSQYQLPAEATEPDVQVAWNYYARELQEYQTLYQQMYPRAAEHGRVVGLPSMTRQQLTYRIDRTEEPEEKVQPGAEFHVHLSQEQRSSILQEIINGPVALTPREAEEQAPELLVEQMNRIDQHNRTLMQTLQQETRRKEPQLPGGPDVQRTMRDALRALEEPELILKEVYSQGETPMVPPSFTPEEEALLRQADPASRVLYEKVLAYQKNPEAALAEGLVQTASMGALQAELKRAAQEVSPRMEHPGMPDTEQTLVRERSEILLEKYLHLPVQRRYSEPPKPLPKAVSFVHKQAATEVTEELLEQLEQRNRSAVKTVTEEDVTRQHTHQVDVKQIEHQVVTQTTEDITELVNRTLARQMRTISDQVYRQMEKRLQSERSRRGRY